MSRYSVEAGCGEGGKTLATPAVRSTQRRQRLIGWLAIVGWFSILGALATGLLVGVAVLEIQVSEIILWWLMIAAAGGLLLLGAVISPQASLSLRLKPTKLEFWLIMIALAGLLGSISLVDSGGPGTATLLCVAAFAEELVFRAGPIALGRRSTFGPASMGALGLVTTVLFAAVHGVLPPGLFVVRLIFAALLFYCCVLSESIWWSFAVHVASNALILTLTELWGATLHPLGALVAGTMLAGLLAIVLARLPAYRQRGILSVTNPPSIDQTPGGRVV